MIVELVKSFQWPDVPENLDPWQKKLWDMREKMIDENQTANMNVQRGEIPLQANKRTESKSREELRKKAQALLRGDVKWENDVTLDPKWESILNKQDPETPAPYRASQLPSRRDVIDKKNAEEKDVAEKLEAIKEENEKKDE